MREPDRSPALHPAYAWPTFAAAVILSSLGAVVKYTHLPGLILYLGAVALALWLIRGHIYPWFVRHVPERYLPWLALLTYFGVLALFAVIYPIANAGIVGGGTDRDDALNLAVRELFHGRYPYYPRTYIGAMISPLPGSLLLAAPFVLLGNSAYQDLFWLVVFYIVTQRYLLGSGHSTLMLSWTLLLLSPLLWQELVTGGDLLANAIYVYVFVLLAIAWNAPGRPAWQGLAAAALLGLGLASRINYALVLVPVTAALVLRLGRRAALGRAALALLVMAALILPFYLYDPAGFTPLRTARLIDQFDKYLPLAGLLFATLMVAAALGLAFRRASSDLPGLLYACALPQAVPILGGLLLFAAAGRFDNTFSVFLGYGFSFLFFTTAATWRQAVVK